MAFARTVFLALALAIGASDRLLVWTLRDGMIVAAPGNAGTAPLPVGSIQKLWVARAWAEAHPGDAPAPTYRCTTRSACWLPAGHGEVGLRRALAVSCNAYFLALAHATPGATLDRVFREAGFEVTAPLDAERSIGLSGLTTLGAGAKVTVKPEALLNAFHLLVTSAWPARDDIRETLLAGLRDASESGTGAASPVQGVLMKTGTVPSVDGRLLATSGWVIAADPTAITVHLALLRNGTGAQAAARLGAWWSASRTGRPEKTIEAKKPDPNAGSEYATQPVASVVAIRLFGSLSPSRITAVNAGSVPILGRTEKGDEEWIGPGAAVEIRAGSHLGDGLWALSVEPYGLVRVVRGTLARSKAGDGLTLTTQLRDWVEGVLRAEAPRLPAMRRREFVPVVLRFLASGPRHGKAEVCDLTHCARFEGFGPDVTWPTPHRAIVSPAPPLPLPFEPQAVVDDATWEASLAEAGHPGPSFWTGHCGGETLSEREVWGRGSSERARCSRHSGGRNAPWSRAFSSALLEKALHRNVVSVEAVELGGTRRTRVTSASGAADFLWDELHRKIAAVAGWDALPSPPDAWRADTAGWTAIGRGAGHRVGYCLAE